MSKIDAILEENKDKLAQMPEKPEPLTHKPVKQALVPVDTMTTGWLELKKEYFLTDKPNLSALSRKYWVDFATLIRKVKEEQWENQRKAIMARADAKLKEYVSDSLGEIKGRHIIIGKALQKIGMRSMKKYKATLNPKDSVHYIAEGIRIEREAHGMDKQSPKIVNIITQQQGVIEKYKAK